MRAVVTGKEESLFQVERGHCVDVAEWMRRDAEDTEKIENSALKCDLALYLSNC